MSWCHGRRTKDTIPMATEAELKAEGEKHIPKDYDPKLYKLRHSLAHVRREDLKLGGSVAAHAFASSISACTGGSSAAVSASSVSDGA